MLLPRLLSLCSLPLAVLSLLLLAASALLPPWTPTYQQNSSTFVYVCNYSGYTDVTSPHAVVPNFGLVCFDWSNAKALWDNARPMDCEERLVEQAAMLKKVRPETKVMVYRNLVKALPWFASVRRLLEDPAYASFFLRFDPSVTPHVPRCDTNYDPPRCSNYYHDQGQTPQYPNNSKFDGTCSAPCDCGGVPCGEYLFDFRNGTALADFLVDQFVLGATGLGSGVIDGVSLDDAWANATDVGSNGCDGSPVGGPSEISSFCNLDMGLTQEDTIALTAGWQRTMDRVHAQVVAHGGYTWPQFQLVSTPPPGDQCAPFFRRVCQGTYQEQAILHTFTEAPGRIFDPLPAFAQDLATFLLTRGPYAWLGYNWNSCTFDGAPAGGRNNQSFSFPAALNGDYGLPTTPTCSETALGVFERTWTRVQVQFDCNTWTGSVKSREE